MGLGRALLAGLCLLGCTVQAATNSSTADRCESARYESKPRVFVLTDISNEPDDQMSLVRLLVHANELQIEGISAITSTWLNDSTDAATIREVIGAYGQVVDNLNSNVPDAGTYPTADELLAKITSGHSVYGLASLNLEPSNASTALVAAVDASSDPLWVTVWGGAAVLAEALNYVDLTRHADKVEEFVRKLRVYSISDQDDAGPWIRQKFPSLFYIVSLAGFSNYITPTWIGISGEAYRKFDKGGPDTSLVTNDWLEEHIRLGKLGEYYPNYTYIMEGDTPSMLNLYRNGLSDPEHPEYGGWGGRYILLDASGKTGVYSDTYDVVQGKNNETFFSQFATIWRWRKAYQYDFAARMQWSVQNDSSVANHHPVAIVNGTCGPSSLELTYKYGESVVLDASETWDPDDDELSFDWFHYRDVVQRLEGDVDIVSKNVTITNLNDAGSIVNVEPLANLTMHLILSVTDDRDLELTTYRRVILYPVA